MLVASMIGSAAAASTGAVPPDPAAPPQPQEAPSGQNNQTEAHTIELPLQEGRLALRDLLAAMCEAAELPRPPGLAALDWSIDVDTMLGWLHLRAIGRATGGAVSFRTETDRLVVAVNRRNLDALRERIEELLGQWLDRAQDPAGLSRGHGLFLVTETGERAPLPAAPSLADRVVVLVHGLDEPGWHWRDVIPALQSAGHTVLRFDYPNDGPVSDSADLFARELEALTAAGATRADIVAHSLGGLVARDVLTRRVYYAGDGTGRGRYPAVDRLILMGTPNAGTHAAVLHGLGELTERVYRGWKGEPGWLNLSADGHGEAAADLLPGSVFLRRLNDRPLPTHTRITIIAGRVSPLSEAELDKLAARMGRLAEGEDTPFWLRRLLDPRSDGGPSLVAAAVRGLGDGLVTLDSARLEGVDDVVVVEGSHASMMVRLFPSDRTPPAIPIILDRLADAAVPAESAPQEQPPPPR